MPRIHETFIHAAPQQGFRLADILILVIICLSLMSIGSQTFSAIDVSEKEKDKKSTLCLKEFKEKDCNVYAPSLQCKTILDCIKSADEPMLDQMKTLAETGYQQIEKLSIIPLLIIGLLILNRRRVQ